MGSKHLNLVLESITLSVNIRATGITNMGPHPGFATNTLLPWASAEFPWVSEMRAGFA